jgi:crotonobetainyl-CoA:carnitine CoA-transferase CaiB-like acyl-CoA transferase
MEVRETDKDGMACGPLSGLLVIDLGRIVAGPLCAMMLGDLGARVIKVETGEDGDFLRTSQPIYAPGIGSYFATVNRNKESVRLDLRSSSGRDVLKRMTARADVIVENFRPGVFEKLGFDDATISRGFPRLIAVRLSAYGHLGPMANDPGVDQIIQGMSGLMSVTGTPETGPIRSGLAISDVLCGLMGCIGALSALHERKASGRGQVVRGSLLQSMLSMMTVQAGKYFATGEVPVAEGNHHPALAPYGLFPTSDGSVQLQIMQDKDFSVFAALCGHPEWATDPAFATAAARSENRIRMSELVVEATPCRTTADWIEKLTALGVPCGPVLNVKEAFESPQALAMGLVQSLTLGDGTAIELPGFPLSMSRTPMELRRAPPVAGEHTEAILAEFGG